MDENPQPETENPIPTERQPEVAIVDKLLAHVIAQQSRAETVQDSLLKEKDRLVNRFSVFLLTTSFLAQTGPVLNQAVQAVDQMQDLFNRVEKLTK